MEEQLLADRDTATYQLLSLWMAGEDSDARFWIDVDAGADRMTPFGIAQAENPFLPVQLQLLRNQLGIEDSVVLNGSVEGLLAALPE